MLLNLILNASGAETASVHLAYKVISLSSLSPAKASIVNSESLNQPLNSKSKSAGCGSLSGNASTSVNGLTILPWPILSNVTVNLGTSTLTSLHLA